MGIAMNYSSLLFVFILWSMLVFSQQSSTQKSVMLNLFHFLHNPQNYASVYYYNSPKWNASTNPCRWEGVICTNNSVTQLHLTYSNYYIRNSSVISIACQIQSLQVLDVSDNYLHSIPDDFLTICGKLPRLKSVNFSLNSISGNLPFNKGGFTSLESLDLSDNALNGSIEAQFDGLVALKSLNLRNNLLTGSIPSNLIGNLKGLQEVDLSYNNFQGRIQEQFVNCNNLRYLDLSYNELTGTIPADLGLCQELLSLNLAENRLSGQLPKELGDLKQLQVLNLEFNGFVGNKLSGLMIPPFIVNLTNLKNLDFSDNNLSGSIPPIIFNLTNLENLDLSNNNFNGSISPSISNLTNLGYLDLSGNELSGLIPTKIGNLHSLIELHLSNNLLVGKIPLMPQKLQILDLSSNKLSGNIPDTLKGMSQLSNLNLASNALSGDIPSQLGFGRLSYLDLSNNNLSGPIPITIQIFGYNRFAGNANLCGYPVTNSCDIAEGEDDPSIQEENEGKDNFYIGLYVSIGIGFYLGFWGVFGTLVLKHSWRYAIFNFIDTVYNRIYVTIAIYVARFQRKSLT